MAINPQKYLKRENYIEPILRLLFILTEIIIAYSIVFNFYISGHISKGLLDFLSLSIIIFMHVYLVQKKNYDIVATVVILLASFNSNMTVYILGLSDLEFTWLMVVPIMTFMLVDLRRSVLLVLLHVSIFSLIYYFYHDTWSINTLDVNGWINMSSLMLVTSIFLYAYENIRQKMATIIEDFMLRESRQKEELLRVNTQLSEYKISLEDKVACALTKQQEIQILLAQQSKMAAMGEMLASIGHQWQQPLSIISANTTNLEFASLSNTLRKEEIGEHTHVITEQIDFMSQTLIQFSDFFKPDKKEENFYMEEAIREILHLFSKVYSAKGIEITIDSTIQVELHNYKNEFRQVILNILNNARDVIVENEVENRSIDIKIFTKNKRVHCEIQDHAGGVSEEMIDTIFDSFVTSKSSGSGIGLYMSKMIIESSMKGELSVENRDDGACFMISFALYGY